MNIVCLDLEGVLVPEIWIAFAEETGIPELKRTTKDFKFSDPDSAQEDLNSPSIRYVGFNVKLNF